MTPKPGEDDGAGNGVGIGYKGAYASARGPFGLVALTMILFALVISGINYKGFEDMKLLLRQSNMQHSNMTTSQDMLTCVLSLSPAQRVQLQNISQRESFQVLCPWMRFSNRLELIP